jgi:ubiquitin-like-conjugating enzyme ATG3
MYNDQVNESNVDSQMGGDNDDDWCAPSVSERRFDEDDEEVLVEKEDSDVAKSVFRLDEGDTAATATTQKEVPPKSKVKDEYEDMTMEDYEDDSLALDDDCVVATSGGGNVSDKDGNANSGIVLARRYDVSITYDNYWRTPRVFLFGYDETGSPMPPEKVFEDVMQDYAQKTVTIEPHPHTNRPHASIHPCQHSAAMKRVLDALMEDEKEVPNVEQYLFIFLKFLQSVIPTIEYDYTIGVQFKGGDKDNK